MAFLDQSDTSETESGKLAPSVDFAAAQSAVERLTREYPAMARDNLQETRARFARAEGNDPEETMQELKRFAHNFAGQGASFNYRMISDIADILRGYLRACGSYDALDRDVVEALLDAFQEVLDKELSGSGGDAGRAILARLNEMVA